MYEFYDAMAYAQLPVRKFASSLRTFFANTLHAMDYGVGRFADGLADMYLRTSR